MTTTADKISIRETLERRSERARKIFERKIEGSWTTGKLADYPKFDRAELHLGKLLGKGDFSKVAEVRAFTIRMNPMDRLATIVVKEADAGVDETHHQKDRKFLAQHCFHPAREGGETRYALKCFSPDTVKDKHLYVQGTAELALETRYLSNLDHKHINKLRAVSHVPPLAPGYFIVVEKLHTTLEARLLKWAAIADRPKAMRYLALTTRSDKKLYKERILAAMQISMGLKYLHLHNIIYRNLKPENIGFDIHQDIKLFNLGKSREPLESLKSKDGTYNLTQLKGSLTYMAPEVATGKGYNHSCDVYSFAILFWQIMTLHTPFQDYTDNPREFKKYVYQCHKRPAFDETWPLHLKVCLIHCWSEDIKERLDMIKVVKILRKQIRHGEHMHNNSWEDAAGGAGKKKNMNEKSFAIRHHDTSSCDSTESFGLLLQGMKGLGITRSAPALVGGGNGSLSR
jgi:serine/threonine protein kinase